MPLAQFTDSAQDLVQASEPTPTPGQIPLFQTLGILLSLYALHRQHDSLTVSQWLSRIMPFLNQKQTRLFLTEDKAPYGFASWIEVPEAVHQQLLETATWFELQPYLTEVLDESTEASSQNSQYPQNEPAYL